MALIMTLSLLPTAALAASGYTLEQTSPTPPISIVGQDSPDITVKLSSTDSATERVRLKIAVTQTIPSSGTGNCTIQRKDTSGTYFLVTDGYLDDGIPLSVSNADPVSVTFKLTFDKPGLYSYRVEAYKVDAAAGTETPLSASYTTVVTANADITSLAVTPDKPEAGQQFTVTAMTNFNYGNVGFTYGTQYETVAVSPRPDGTGYAKCTFTAETGVTGVKATLFGDPGIPDATKTATVNVATPATYHTVTFHENAAGVYNMPAPQPVKHGEQATEPTVKPQRDGYTFDGWYKDAACTTSFTLTTPVTEDLHLYAGWKKVTYPVQIFFHTTGVNVFPTTQNPAAVGETVDFNVTVPAKYDTTNMLVSSGESGVSIILAPSSQHTDSTHGTTTFYYHFEVKDQMIDRSDPANPVILILVNPLPAKTFTVMMPTGHFTAQITSVSGTAQAAGTTFANVEHGGSYTFTVTPHAGYDVEVYVNSVKQTAGADGKYTVPDVTGPQRVEVVESAIPNYNVTFTVPLSGQSFTQSVTRGGNASKPGVDPEREGYTFAGWYTEAEYKKDTGATQFNFTTEKINKDTVLYGKLTPKIYKIQYNLNGASGTAPADQLKTHGLAEKLSETVPTREGYTFLGWGTTATATAASYQPGDMYSVDQDITLYAVWQQNTYTVTLPSGGTGFTVNSDQSRTVVYDGNFTFTVTVDRLYASDAPTVKANGTNLPANGEATTNPDGSKTYSYTISNITKDQVVSVQAVKNLVYTVTFMTGDSVYQTQQVGYGEKATRPVDPVVEGYTFGGWYQNAECTNAWNFVDVTDAGGNVTAANTVTGNTSLYAKLTPIKPVITWPLAVEQVGYALKFTMPDALVTATGNTGTVAYNDKVTFTITVADGYDASKMQVGVNGILYAPNEKNGNVYTFEFTAKEDTKITVTGIERKTITITYNANARDDVSGLPSPQVVKYYLAALGETGNDKITTQVPSRTGYTFLGWNTDSEAKEADARYTAEKIRAGAASEFTQDTTLYAIWEAQDTELTLKITDVAYDTQQNNRVIQYEGESITLQATLNHFAVGSVTFYKSSTKEANKTNSTIVGSTSIEGTTATFRTTVGEYKTTAKDEYYWAEFTPNADEGYSGSTSGVMNVGIFSKALSWKITKGTSNVADNGNVLNVYEGDSATGTPITGNMVAGRTYTLEVKTASITGVETLNTKQPELGKDYKIVWQYTEVGKNDWKTDGEASDKATYLVTGDKSGYQFRAQIVPLGPDNGSLFVKAGKFENDALVNNQYDTCLYTKSTDTTVRQATATTLTIDAPEESKDIKINGDTPFTAIGDHKAQFEGQAVTLTAKVTKDGGTGVETGYVKFYRYVDGTNDTLLNTTLISVDANGIATLEVKVSAWDTAKDAAQNLDQFYAVYETNETYETSKSDSEAVYIKSAKLMTPIIESELEGTNGAKATTYSEDLNGLLAGVQHTFKLRQDADQTTKDYSVVALDGRTVAAKNYDIEWQYKTDGNFAKAGNDSTAVTYTTKTTEVGDQYRVVLKAKGDMTVGATSKVAEIGKKQDVTVTVKAIDAITKTPETDVYQLNEITLTATVAAANDKPTMQPTGTVTFYYKDGENWVKLDSATLAEDTNHSMTASITTKKLPVTDTTNIKRDVEITAVYEGNDTFNASATVNETEKSITAAAGCTTTNDTVTVYSSVVFNCNDENKKQTTNGDKGIHISVSDGVLKTNETATLALSDIYTLDRNLDKALLNTIAKLNPTTDYTVQWQKLNGATAITSGDYGAAKNWTNIDGKTGTTLVLDKVEQNTAYRAVITVNDQPITKGSSTEVNQTIKGRQVYYSNVLMPTDTNMTVSVALNTSKIGAENTEGITEGETVTANVFLSGVVGVVPNANVTVTVTNDSAKGNNTAYEKTFTSMNTVNGWNAFSWNTAESDDKGVPTAPGFYTLTVSATTNTGYAAKEITRSLIVRESSYDFEVGNTNPTYNGRTQGLTVALKDFHFSGDAIDNAANKSWTVKYYDQQGKLVEPSQAGKYTATITLPASAYWTEQRIEKTFTIKQRSVSIADAIAQAKVYDGTTDVNIVEVMLNDAETEQGTTGWLKSGENTGIINGDSIYAVATAAVLEKANAGENKFTISAIDLLGDDANNYVWDKASYTENIYVSRSQVYGEHGTLELKQGETFPADKVIKMIDQSGREITLGTGTEDYTLTFYYHSDTKIEKTTDISKLGLYTVVARPNQANYKSGVTMKFEVVNDANTYTPAAEPKPSTLIDLTNTATMYNPMGNVGVTATSSQGNTVEVKYQNGTDWSTDVPANAGRYLVKATDAISGDVAYGIYTITKAHPSISITAAEATYNSMPYTGATPDLTKATENPEHYLTYAGDVAIGYNTPADGNVDEQAPVDAGTYTVTLHVNETANYTAHEISKSFTIAKKALTIKADSWQTTQYDAFPDMTAGYTGLAAETGDTTPDTSLRDVQIAPEFLYNPTGGKSNYSNDSLDQVGGVAIQPIDALSKNYAITYEKGQYTKQRTETNVDLDIHGLPQSSTGTNTVYYGDVIQLYPYGYYTTHANGSGIFNWSVSAGAPATIDADKGILKVTGVGEFIVTLTRGEGELQIKTELTVTALKKEVKVHVTDQDKVYSGSAQTYSGEVKAYDELYATVNAATTTPANNTRTDIGTQITTSRIATGSEKYQSLVYGGQFTINDKEASVAPGAQSTVYGTLEAFDATKCTVTGKAGSVDPVTGVNVASQTDAYNRLDVHDGYEILVAGAENMNYNVKYTTDETAEDSAVTTYGSETFTSKTTEELNDATVYGETPNVLNWTLVNVIGTTRDSVDYADNLADFDLPTTFVEQDKDDCTGNKVTYKAANRTTEISGSTVEYNQAALTGPRTSTDTATDENYTLKFNTVENSGKALLANNYKLTNVKTGNSATTTNALTANSKGFIPAAGESNDVSGENFVEGSANIAQRPIKLEKAVTDAQLYWRLPQSQLYTALVNILKAEENSVGRGLAKGHTIEDLDLSFTIGSTPVDKNNDQPMTGLTVGTQTVTVTVGDTNYKLEGGQYQFDIVLKNIQIEATYTTKTFTGFTVLIKVHNENGKITPLNDAKGLSYKIFKKTGDAIDKTTAYASGTLTYQNRTAYDDKGGLCGVFTATYPQLPLLNSGETYFIQMYEYGVELKTNS